MRIMTGQIWMAVLAATLLAGLFTPWSGSAQAPVSGDDSPVTGLTTLYSRDPLACKMSFATGDYGGVFQDHMVKNNQSDIDFGCYNQDEFTVGIEGGRLGAIVDLGTPADLQEEYGYAETVGGGQGFASIRIEDELCVILADYEKQTTQNLRGLDSLFSLPISSAHVPVVEDHIYLIRLVDQHEPNFRRIVKLHVVAYLPGECVTLRWTRIER